MLFPKRCEVIDLNCGESNSAIEESKTPKIDLIESGLDFIKAKDGYDYSVLIVLENWTLLSTSYENIRLNDFDFSSFYLDRVLWRKLNEHQLSSQLTGLLAR